MSKSSHQPNIWHKAMRLLYLSMLFLGLIWPLFAPAARASAQAVPGTDDRQVVVVLTFDGAVTPVLHKYIQDGITLAQQLNAQAMILQLDTPGGSVDITKNIVQTMLQSPVPVMVYVSPTGAHAGSAGTFITLAGHVAVMAPGSSIGAASPVGGSGEDIGETMQAKVTNILSADIENLADRRGEAAVEWALRAVQEAAAATAPQALELGVIDFIAPDLLDLLAQTDGLTITVLGEERTLHTADAAVEYLDMNPLQDFLNFISNPSIASILLTLGTLGLITELRIPGFGAPGIIGAICLLLAFYALGQLDANFAGLALIGLAIALLIAELFTPTFGVLAAGGLAAFVFGAALLFDAPGVAVPWGTIITMAALMGGFILFAGGKALAAQRRQPYSGMEGLINQTATAKIAFGPGETGSVFLAGEWWNAELESGRVEAGERVTVTGQRGYTLIVKK
ncbi:MAG: nodulation protein NfeD [Caldilineaceae bacterium]|nr:nodulation protein NfeD [Caldilineaceae bacterium]MBP8107843.1 nodulation protein NfeD [Caldilineaceae bacterium]MBP8122969.1 nodulation protein NfeD [Caldilineaceae bacterium]MBP9073166.1 nodulation protein NfeD [Caldilineaceae bacterium]